MENNVKVVLAFALVAIVAFGIYYMGPGSQSPYGPTPTPNVGENPPVFASPLPNPTDAISTSDVKILYGSFRPQAIRVTVGSTVTWENQDGVIHSITSGTDSPIKFSSGIIGGRQTWSYTFSGPGAYPYYDDTTRQAQGVVYVG